MDNTFHMEILACYKTHTEYTSTDTNYKSCLNTVTNSDIANNHFIYFKPLYLLYLFIFIVIDNISANLHIPEHAYHAQIAATLLCTFLYLFQIHA